jgi:hypothetical protein
MWMIQHMSKQTCGCLGNLVGSLCQAAMCAAAPLQQGRGPARPLRRGSSPAGTPTTVVQAQRVWSIQQVAAAYKAGPCTAVPALQVRGSCQAVAIPLGESHQPVVGAPQGRHPHRSPLAFWLLTSCVEAACLVGDVWRSLGGGCLVGDVWRCGC